MKPRLTAEQRFVRNARLAGWHTGSGIVSSEHEQFLFSPRIWIADVESAACATDLVRELTELRPVDDQECQRKQLLNPQYGHVRCDDLPTGDQASALAAIQHLRSTESIETWGDIVRPLLSRVDRFLEARQAIRQAADSLSGAPREKTNDDAGTSTDKGRQTLVSKEARAGGSADPAEEDGRQQTIMKDLTPSVKNAYLSYTLAERTAGHRLEDRQAYDWLKNNDWQDEKRCPGSLAKYDLPAFETWSRQLRAARKALGEQKHSSRASRRTGGSVVGADQI